MTNPLDPFKMWANSLELARLGFEANSIIAMRMMGFMGYWRVRDTEALRMVTEKPAAFMESWYRGASAAMEGAAPEKVLKEAIKPIRRKTRSNHARLMRSGPKLGGS